MTLLKCDGMRIGAKGTIKEVNEVAQNRHIEADTDATSGNRCLTKPEILRMI